MKKNILLISFASIALTVLAHKAMFKAPEYDVSSKDQTNYEQSKISVRPMIVVRTNFEECKK